MKRLASLLIGFISLSTLAAAQNPPAQAPQIDCTWLTVDSATKTATFQVTAGLTQLNGGLNFNGFNDGKLTLTVPTNWNVVMRFVTTRISRIPSKSSIP